MTTTSSAPQPPETSGLAEFTRAWAAALAGTSYVPLTRAERHSFLHHLAHRLAAALAAEPFSNSYGYDIGTELVAADFAAPEALGRTVTVIDDRFLKDLGLTGEQPRRRLAEILGALAAGYTWALRDRTLDEHAGQGRGEARALRGRAATACAARAYDALQRSKDSERWRALALREGTIDPQHPAVVAAAPEDADSVVCPACGTVGPLADGACADCGLQLG